MRGEQNPTSLEWMGLNNIIWSFHPLHWLLFPLNIVKENRHWPYAVPKIWNILLKSYITSMEMMARVIRRSMPIIESVECGVDCNLVGCIMELNLLIFLKLWHRFLLSTERVYAISCNGGLMIVERCSPGCNQNNSLFMMYWAQTDSQAQTNICAIWGNDIDNYNSYYSTRCYTHAALHSIPYIYPEISQGLWRSLGQLSDSMIIISRVVGCGSALRRPSAPPLACLEPVRLNRSRKQRPTSGMDTAQLSRSCRVRREREENGAPI